MTGWLGTEYFISACLALFIVDRVGRRNLMMWGAAGMAISLAVIGGSLSSVTEQNKTGAYVATVFIFVYDTCFAIGWLGVAWVSACEQVEVIVINSFAVISGRSNFNPYQS